MNIFGLGLPELIIIALIVLLFFGKDRLPGLFRSVGTSIKELKDGLNAETTPKPAAPAPSVSSTPAAVSAQNADEPKQADTV